jgi:hypothetical protein
MTKYCIMRECENNHSWISLSGDLAFSHQDRSIALAAAQVPFKTAKMKEYINFAGHSKGHGNAPVLYIAHHPMEEF